MNEYLSLRKELLNLKERNVNLTPKIVSMVIEKKIKDKRVKYLLFAILAISITIFLIFIFRREN